MNNPEGQTQEPVGGMKTKEEIIRDLKALRNYFGVHDVTMEEHRLYSVADKLVKYFTASLPSSSVAVEEGKIAELKIRNIVHSIVNGSTHPLTASNDLIKIIVPFLSPSIPVTGESEAINKAIIEELQSLLSSGVHSEYLPEKINDRISELKGDKSYT